MAEKFYRVLSINDRGNYTCTQLSGSYGETLADKHWNDLVAEDRTMFAVIVIIGFDGKESIRAQYYRHDHSKDIAIEQGGNDRSNE